MVCLDFLSPLGLHLDRILESSARYLKQEEWDPYNIPFRTGLTILALIGLRKAFQNRNATAIPYLILILVFPACYYTTSPEVYYRRPIDPMLLVLAVYAVTTWLQNAEPHRIDK
jgi:hypothetical protein